MLLALLPLTSWAQFAENNYVPKGDFIYKITHAAAGETPGKVVLYGIRDGRNPVDANKALNLEGKITIGIIDGPSFDFVVDYALADALKKTYTFTNYTTEPTEAGVFEGMTVAESVVIPKEFLTIKENTFYGYTNMKSISFEENSEVTTIESGAFNTTQIREFDFSSCSKLTTINNGLFVQASPAINSYVKTIILPEESEALVTIGTAFQRLTNLEEIRNLDKSLITTVEAFAFDGDANLTALALPATITGISKNAFKGSGVKTLTIDVTSMDDDAIGDDDYDGNVYGTDVTTLETLNLKGVLSGEFKPGAFAGCTNLATINMSYEGDDAANNFVITGGTIGASAFEGCTKLATLAFNNITDGTIGQAAFKGCTKLGNISFGDLDHVVFAEEAFANCYGATVTGTNNPLSFGNINNVTIAGFDENGDDPDLLGAFANCQKLTSVKFAAEDDQAIADFAIENQAFEGSAVTSKATLTFGDAENLTIGEAAFKGATKIEEITFGDILADDDPVTVEIAGSAFENCTGLKNLAFGNLTRVNIAEDAFKAATSGLASAVATASFGDLTATTIADGAFTGATKLATVSIGDVLAGSTIGAGAVVFPAVKTVTIGTVASTSTLATAIAAKAFTFANVDNTTLNLAAGEDEYLEDLTPLATPLIAAGAFDFSAVAAATAAAKSPVVTIGEIKSANVFTAGALKGNKIAKIVFDGDIATNGLAVTVITNNAATGVADLTLSTLVFNGALAEGAIAANAFAALPAVNAITFNGEIAEGGIATDAFKGLVAVNTITFTGKLAEEAVAAGAFEGLVANSQVNYNYDGADIDLTVNPFAKNVFKALGTSGEDRIIKFSVKNTGLKAKFWDAVDGLGHDGDFDVYLAIYEEPVEPDYSFLVYPQLLASSTTAASPSTAWARWELGARKVDGGTLDAGTNLVIKRSQKIDGTNDAKITIYGTYTDEDDALKTSTIYMVPLKVTNGYYYIPGGNKTTLIVKVDNAADFTENSYKVKVNEDLTNHPYVGANNSIWNGLENKELYVASNIMTNQQLIDKLAVDAQSPAWEDGDQYGYYHAEHAIDIYRTDEADEYDGTTVAEDLYTMSDPSKNKGFRIAVTEITDKNDVYINAGWYYMLLKKYTETPAAAHVVWMDDATEGDITGILTVKDNAKNVVKSDAIYTLQGVRVSEMQKGNIYIVNGKKYIAK